MLTLEDTRKRILFIDADKEVADDAIHRLRESGFVKEEYEFIWLSTHEIGYLTLDRGDPIDAVIAAWTNPNAKGERFRGRNFIEALRSHGSARLRDIPVIFYSGDPECELYVPPFAHTSFVSKFESCRLPVLLAQLLGSVVQNGYA